MIAQFAMTTFFNILLTGTLSQMWNIFNTMQLISALPNFAVKTPANLETVHKSFDEIVNFKIVSKELIYDYIIVPILGFDSSDQLYAKAVETLVENTTKTSEGEDSEETSVTSETN